jgi:hypothetical protein
MRARRTTAWRPLSQQDHEVLEVDLRLATTTVEAYTTWLLARSGALSRTDLAVATPGLRMTIQALVRVPANQLR